MKITCYCLVELHETIIVRCMKNAIVLFLGFQEIQEQNKVSAVRCREYNRLKLEKQKHAKNRISCWTRQSGHVYNNSYIQKKYMCENFKNHS